MRADDGEGQNSGKRVFNGLLLRAKRLEKGWSLADVERRSRKLAERIGSPALLIFKSRLSDIERRGQPGAAKMAALAAILGLSSRDLLRLYSPQQP